jgi:dipeptidyl aminopeptidase/acylaminoacyl peptidase
VILLHGANGIRYANPVVSGVMQYLGVHDLVVHLVHYFDRTGTSYADTATIQESFGVWLETVEEGIRHIQAYCEGAPLGMFGHSLGGYLTAATLIRNPAVQAAVILSGGLDEDSARAVKRTAPTLILHGAADTRVPITEARRLEGALTGAGAAPEFHTYAGEGHILEMVSYADAMDRAMRFLRRHLG